MNRRSNGGPQTPVRNDDALEKSMRRLNSSRTDFSIASTARRIQESPLRRDSTTPPGGSSNRTSLNTQSAPSRSVDAAEFQEWMKMVRMKRVKANNAFTIQLIDAFHGMIRGDILSQDGHGLSQTSDGVSFQEASHTLGGCVTVYRSRIAKVKDDTAKLLEGFSRSKLSQGSDNGEASSQLSHAQSESDGDTSDDEASQLKKRPKKKPPLTNAHLNNERSCLLPVAKLSIDTNELATTIDPLLRKMAADFDKRGAEALLDYVLKINREGRLHLGTDTSKSSNPINSPPSAETNAGNLASIAEANEEEAETPNFTSNIPPRDEANDRHLTTPAGPNLSIDLAQINVDMFANVSFGRKEALPLVNAISRAVSSPQEATDELLRSIRAWSMADPGNTSTYDDHDVSNTGTNGDDYNDLNDHEVDNNDDLLAHNDDNHLALDEFNADNNIEIDDPANSEEEDAVNPVGNLSLMSMISNRVPPNGQWLDVESLQSMDSKSLGGLSSWKANNKKLYRARRAEEAAKLPETSTKPPPKTSRERANAPAFIDFHDLHEVDLEALNEGPKPRSLLRSKLTDRNLMPKEVSIPIRHLISLSLRPKTGVARAFRHGMWGNAAKQWALNAPDSHDLSTDPNDLSAVNGTHDMSHFNHSLDAADDNYFHAGWDNDVASRPATAAELFPQQAGAGLVSNQLNYARAAKRIDLRRLKDNVWRSIHASVSAPSLPIPTAKASSSGDSSHDKPLDQSAALPHSLLQVIRDTQPLYTEQELSDLSPAMYFVSLLHLSNEHGLTLHNNDTLTDVLIGEGSVTA